MADYDSDDDEAYFLDLVFRSADERDILERVREHETFKQIRAHAEKGYSRLTADQIDKALDLNVVKWSQFHLKVMQSVTDNRVSNKPLQSVTFNILKYAMKLNGKSKKLSGLNSNEIDIIEDNE